MARKEKGPAPFTQLLMMAILLITGGLVFLSIVTHASLPNSAVDRFAFPGPVALVAKRSDARVPTAAAGRREAPRSAEDNLHIAYQVACSAYSLHQAHALDWSWRSVSQRGRLTRIVCGCESEADRARLSSSPLEGDPRFLVFFTIDWNEYVPSAFREAAGDDYHAYNHPFGIQAWLLESPPGEDFVMYMEPDMVFIRAVQNHIAGGPAGALATKAIDGGPLVALGRPVAQEYQYVFAHTRPEDVSDPGWLDVATAGVCGADCPTGMSAEEGDEYYAVGPPTILHKDDWKRLLPRWCNYSVRVRNAAHIQNGQSWLKEGSRVYIAEMLAYSLAAATIGLRHSKALEMAVDPIHTCQYYPEQRTRDCPAPNILHYCYPQNAVTPVGHWIWNKYRSSIGYGLDGRRQWKEPTFLDCDMPLFQTPPNVTVDLVAQGETATFTRRQWHVLWMIREIVTAYNGAAITEKRKRCPHGAETRQLLRVTEGLTFVPADLLRAGEPPLSARLVNLVRDMRSVIFEERDFG